MYEFYCTQCRTKLSLNLPEGVEGNKWQYTCPACNANLLFVQCETYGYACCNCQVEMLAATYTINGVKTKNIVCGNCNTLQGIPPNAVRYFPIESDSRWVSASAEEIIRDSRPNFKTEFVINVVATIIALGVVVLLLYAYGMVALVALGAAGAALAKK